MKNQKNNIVISGGGTGGHIFPAISIADEILIRDKNINVIFIGAKNKMEMNIIPKKGYKIYGINISGISRTLNYKLFIFPFKLLIGLIQSFIILIKLKPKCVIGTGGFVSGPVIFIAQLLGINTYIQEQNFFPGITNKILSKRAKKIFVNFEGMEKFFNKSKIFITGNPIRKEFLSINNLDKSHILTKMGINNNNKNLFIFGGSQGALSINKAVLKNIDGLLNLNINIIWQTGKDFFMERQKPFHSNLIILPFIDNMDEIYFISDLVISRAGAITISELCITEKPAILIPLTTAAEDHQTKNAQKMVDENAAILLKNNMAETQLLAYVKSYIFDDSKLGDFKNNLRRLARPNSVHNIVDGILK